MLFSSLVFLWYFLPVTVLLYFLVPGINRKNGILLAASLFFYAWGEPKYVILMIISIILNFGFGILIDKKPVKIWLFLCVAVNLALLGYFKYFNFLGELFNRVMPGSPLVLKDIALPIGISFYTFQALSYVVDVYRGTIKVQKNIWDLALYISFFPQLIAGPIVKYHDIETQLKVRQHSWDKGAYGIKRFVYGLGKKVIFANTFAAVVDHVLSDSIRPYMGTGLTWFVMVLYGQQIYYDFSGYSDMAIGLGKLFGFDFMENFNYPYLSASVREFWRRWHISLSTWFKEYVYIPLGGSRSGKMKTYRNLFIVFLVTGVWHGAGLNFVLWGMYYGVFIVVERILEERMIGRIFSGGIRRLFGHLYTLMVVLGGWVLFRMEYFSDVRHMWRVMFLEKGGPYTISMFSDMRIYTIAALGLLLCGPVQALCPGLREYLYQEERISFMDVVLMAAVLCVCLILLVCNTYNPFIYFRF